MPSLVHGDGGGGRRPGATQRRADPRPRPSGSGSSSARSAGSSRPATPPEPGAAVDAAVERLRLMADMRTAASGGARSSRRRRRSSCCSAGRRGRREMVEVTLRRDGPRRHLRPARRRLRPLLGRRRWLVPHFEKMLYDNALLARAYLHGWQARPRALPPRLRADAGLGRSARCARPEGGFYSALDADSEGEEGRFYVWSASGIARGAQGGRLVGDDSRTSADHYGVSRRRRELRGAQHPPRGRGGPSDQERRWTRGRCGRRCYEAARARAPGRACDDKRLASLERP